MVISDDELEKVKHMSAALLYFQNTAANDDKVAPYMVFYKAVKDLEQFYIDKHEQAKAADDYFNRTRD